MKEHQCKQTLTHSEWTTEKKFIKWKRSDAADTGNSLFLNSWVKIFVLGFFEPTSGYETLWYCRTKFFTCLIICFSVCGSASVRVCLLSFFGCSALFDPITQKTHSEFTESVSTKYYLYCFWENCSFYCSIHWSSCLIICVTTPKTNDEFSWYVNKSFKVLASTSRPVKSKKTPRKQFN